jgi:hypothetical protein
MNHRPTIVWCAGSVAMPNHGSPGRARPHKLRYVAPSRHLGTARECARRSGYSVTVSVERVVVSLIEGLSHHRVVRGQRFNAYAPLNGPLTPVHKLRDVLVPAPRRSARRRAEEVLIVSVGRVDPLNQRLSHHRVVRGQLPNTQTRRFRPFTRAQRLRGSFFVLRSRARAGAILVTYGS